jgi:autotransporter-associated beta strand protein
MNTTSSRSRRITAFKKDGLLSFVFLGRNGLFINLVAPIILALAGAVSSRAATVNWITNIPDVYTNKADWSTGNLPANADTAAIGNATVATGSVLYTNNPGDPPPTNVISGLQLGGTASSTGTFTMGSGSLTISNAGGNVFVPGNGNNSTGTFIMNGGNLTCLRNTSTFFQDFLVPGNATGSSGTFTLNGGTANFLCGIEIGVNGTGTMNVNGGTLIDNGWFGVGRGNATNSPGQGFFNMTGGTVYLLRNPGTDSGFNGISFCQQTTNAAVTISGGAIYCPCIRMGAANVNGSRTTYEALNISGGDIYVGSAGVFSQAGAGTHNLTVNLSGGTFHSVDLGPNTGGTNGLASVLTDGVNWTWNLPTTASINASPGSGTVTFAPDTNRTITLATGFTGNGNLAMTGPGTLVINSSLGYSGSTTITGGTVMGTGSATGGPASVSSPAAIEPGTAIAAGTLSLGNGLTLNGNTNIIKLSGDPTQVGNNVNDLLASGGGLTLLGVSTVQIVPLAPLNTTQPYTIITYSGTPLTAGDAAHLHVVSTSARYNVSVLDPSTTPGSIQVQFTGNAGNLAWRGGVLANPTAWDNTTTNWLNTGTSSLDLFYAGDAVTFDDSGRTNLVNIVGSQVPASIVMTNNALAYTFTGGTLGGTIDMEGTNSLTLQMSNSPTFVGITNNAGPLVLNFQGSGTYNIAGSITDNGGGNGRLVKSGTNTVALLGDNSQYHGKIYVTNGVLQYTNLNGLGFSSTPMYVTNGATLDLNGASPGNKPITVSGSGYNGQGALNNSSSTGVVNANGVAFLTLAGDTTFGASNNRWDCDGNGNAGFAGNGFNLTMIGPGAVLITDNGETSLGNIHITAGRLGFQGGVTMGDTNKTATIEAGATLTFFSASNTALPNNGEGKNLVFNGGVFDSGGTTNFFLGPILLNSNILIGTRGSLRISNTISGSGGFALGNDAVGTSSGDLYLDAPNSYSGPTTISNRTVFVGAGSSLGSSSLVDVLSGAKLDVTAQSTFTFNSGQVLAGNGTVGGNSIVFATGSGLTPGTGGTNASSLTMNGSLTMQLGSTNVVVVEKAAGITSSQVVGLTSVSIAGTLVVSNYGNALAAGDSIPVFSSTGYGGGFSQIIPSTPGSGLAWDTSTLANDGHVRVITSGPPSTPTNIVYSFSAGQLTLSWPSNYVGWALQSQTNAAGSAGIHTNNWIDVPGATNTNQVVIQVSPTNGSAFYRMILRQ